MRQRTRSVVNVREYFRADGSDDEDAEDWMAIAMQGAPPRKPRTVGVDALKPKKARARTSTCDSLAETDDDTDDEEDDGILRVRACSHDRRISFDDDVNVVEIPARSSFDADYKRRVWYSQDELRRSQECC
ncbi:hypothetical protein PHYSODRAFT_286270 [Phytophthora sojae]|uniref:Uncharacterized protein n=1 Tax=Phytophthora sojae (strain P6497) TaxID=1094619 RepID=G4ZK86_PHYSP|nr:hypothetical protein PHYSODRAFT_286270 [Phytophthora sojae]EGZ15203.1 hypothetical protein PHYSODRAFT_286270 [Phytophthora sojae]|eukprot:XP_009528952.1 hypothetical protein PHYSODRAFT_286270 [Phytophthora sojae]